MPQIFTVYQIVLDDHLVDLINKEGWDCHPKAMAYSKASLNGDATWGIRHLCYDKVAEIVADDLDHVFDVGNIGPEDRITRLGDRMTSISVGNIIADQAGNRWVVAPMGFTPVDEMLDAA